MGTLVMNLLEIRLIFRLQLENENGIQETVYQCWSF